MKKAVLAALVAAASFQAVGSEYVNDGWYIGADVIGTTFEADGSDSSPSSTSGAIAVGYDFKLSDSVVLGIEAEYADYGKFDFDLPEGFIDGSLSVDKISYDFRAISLYLKPKFFIGNSPVYVGALAGVGMYHATVDVPVNYSVYGFDSTTTVRAEDQNETEFVYGLEAGYAFNSHLLINVGYRMVNFKEFEHDTWYAGLDYKF